MRLGVLGDSDRSDCGGVARIKAYLDQIQERMVVEKLNSVQIHFSLGFCYKGKKRNGM